MVASILNPLAENTISEFQNKKLSQIESVEQMMQFLE